ncbi:MAG TPA: argininosuccinate synthase, partial [Candidatus Baltobacteraceae bacterium]|nr:argininosuccinate synthase [Candidatus Baltobacteraceae bacterium]
MKKVVLAYSGGLDTSVAVAWLREQFDAEVVTLTVDLGGGSLRPGVEGRALSAGASRAYVVDARERFVRSFVWPDLQADALYQGAYPLATALARPLIAQLLVEVAAREGADAVAHGCTGKGNDQVRFDVAVHALDPGLEVVAPMRVGMGLSREEEIDYAAARGIEVPITKASPYSIDVNLWGRSIETGVLEDPWVAPPADVFEWTVDPSAAPAPVEVTIGFEGGLPVELDGAPVDPVELVDRLSALAGAHGVGRVDHVEDRLVGIKSREIYEAPAATVLHTAHRALESLCLTKDTLRFGRLVS